MALDNPQRLPLTLLSVVGDRCAQVACPGTVASCTLECASGIYVVRADSSAGELAVPAPLLAIALGAAPELRIRIEMPPTAAARLGPDFAFVPAGPALIGDELGVGQEDERPVRVVDVSAFAIGRREVTNGEYAAFLGAVATVDSAWCAFDSKKCRLAHDEAGRWSSSAAHLPVVTVSLAGAKAYCEWLTRARGVVHRLPTEIEWEKAARGPESFVFGYGNIYRRYAANQESGSLREGARGPANGFGLFDMTGNAFEWTSDAFQAHGPFGAASGFQVLRGGSFILDGMYLRNSFRMRQRPDVRADDIGFRVVREFDAGSQEASR